MLKHTFLHIPGIGYLTEEKLWAQGYLCWEDYLYDCEDCFLSPTERATVSEHLEDSMRALRADNARHFETRLPPGEMWRLYPEFQEKVAFLDIETTGLYAETDAITIIGLFDGQQTKVFVKGLNLRDFASEIKKYSLIVTFNGKRFDVPFITHLFGEMPPHQAHLDLLYVMRKLGYQGGLKSIERQLGIKRDGALREADGYMAILLWREYQRGNSTALDTLIRYNLEDVVNLQYLTELAYNKILSRLPIRLPPLEVHTKFSVHIPFDGDLIHDLKQRSDEMLHS